MLTTSLPFKVADLSLEASEQKAILSALSERDPTARVCADAKVSDTPERGFNRLAVGDESVGGWNVKLQERKPSRR